MLDEQAPLRRSAFLSPAQTIALGLTLWNALGPRALALIRELCDAQGTPDSWPEVIGRVASERLGAPGRVADGTVAALLDPPDAVVDISVELAVRLGLGGAAVHPLQHLPPSLIQHAADRTALEGLRQVAGLDMVIKKFAEWRSGVNQHLSAREKIRVSQLQFADLHAIWVEAVERSGVSQAPALFVEAGLNAYARGGGASFEVVVGSGLVSLLEPAELLFVFGHELGHIRSDHCMYRQVTETMTDGAGGFMAVLAGIPFGLGRLAVSPIHMALRHWYRMSELTADRFGLLVCEDIDAAGRVLMKLAGTPPRYFARMSWRAFAAQAAGSELGAAQKAAAWYEGSSKSHPDLAVRAAELIAWQPEYDRFMALDPDRFGRAVRGMERMQELLSGPPRAPTVSMPAPGTSCSSCSQPLDPTQRFCDVCGARRA